jgi:PAS domain S-box-containing protein
MNKAIIDNLNLNEVAVILIDGQEKIEFISQAAKTILGMEDIEGRLLSSVIDFDIGVFEDKGELTGFKITIGSGEDKSEVELYKKSSFLSEIMKYIEWQEERIKFNRGLFHSTHEGVSIVDEEGMVEYVNPRYTELTGYTEDQVLGKLCSTDLSPGDGESVLLESLKTQKTVRRGRKKAGPLNREVMVEASPIFVDGKLKGSIAIMRDVTMINSLINELDTVKERMRKIESKYTFDDIIGESEAMKDAMRKAKNAAHTSATVILRGETGTGKELFAHAIHNESERKYGALVRVNCAALNENILESELFGYVEGAFTGAVKGGRQGLFEKADGGTIFLDEIGEISLNMQVKLLRVLQEKEVCRVGSSEYKPIDVRVISATNVNLEKSVEEGLFRKDLYYRLNFIEIRIPPLRDRGNDLKRIIKHLINKYNQEYTLFVSDISDEVIEILKEFHWPGNIRQLENYIGRICINLKKTDTVILPKHLVDDSHMLKTIKNESSEEYMYDMEDNLKLSEVLDYYEKMYIEKMLKKNKGSKNLTARTLDISNRTLFYKIKKYDINN